MERHGHRIVVTSFILASLLLAACGRKAETPVPPPPPPPHTDQEHVDRYQQCWGFFNDKKFDELKSCYESFAKAWQYGYGKGTEVNGADEIVAVSQAFASAAPDVRGDPQLILVNGNRVASIQLLTGTNTAPMTGADGKPMRATKKKFALLFAHTVELMPESLKAFKETGVMDSATFASQLGMMKRPARPLATGVATPEIVIARNDETEMTNLEAENRQLAAWNKHDLAGVQALAADDAVFHDMTSAKDANREQSGQMDQAYWAAFSNAHIVITTMWTAGDYVVYTGTFDGTNDGAAPSMGMAKATGQSVSVPYVAFDKFKGGKIQETWLFFDSAQFGTQLAAKSGK